METNYIKKAFTDEEKSCLREFESDYESHLSQVDDPVPGTCGWILQHEKWIQFDSSLTSSLLWITADAGCGKSVTAQDISSTITKLEVAKGMSVIFLA